MGTGKEGAAQTGGADGDDLQAGAQGQVCGLLCTSLAFVTPPPLEPIACLFLMPLGLSLRQLSLTVRTHLTSSFPGLSRVPPTSALPEECSKLQSNRAALLPKTCHGFTLL